jgi:ribosomal protein S18 acetylase RimI-like enzyme
MERGAASRAVSSSPVEGAEALSAHDRPRPDGSDIRKVTAADVPAVARSLAEAFSDDPHMRWVMPDDGARMERLEAGFATYLHRIWLPQRECYTHERLIGAAIWMPPGSWEMSAFAQLRLLPALLWAARGSLPRLMKLISMMEKKHPHEPAHWYLPVVGIASEWQGRGFGAALLAPVLERCDAERLPAYLEATSPRNRALYERHGFEVVEECRCADDAPPLWRMWREPVAIQAPTVGE